MIESVLNNHVDDYKSVSVEDYIAMRKKHFAHKKEDFTALKPYQSIVVLALSFPLEQAKYKGKGYGYISRYAHGMDYHLVFREKLRNIEEALAKENIQAKGNVDINSIDERFAAFLAGMGFIGHNQFLIHPTYGTHLYLATLLVDKTVTTTDYLLDDCGECTRCIDACPGNALAPHSFDIEKCLSHITQEKKPLSTAEIKKFKSNIFGCDICQNVCPKNKGITPIKRSVFESDENAQIHLRTLLESSNKELMKRYENYAFAWRGMSVLKRNALALMLNQKDDSLEYYALKLSESLPNTPWLQTTINTIMKEVK